MEYKQILKFPLQVTPGAKEFQAPKGSRYVSIALVQGLPVMYLLCPVTKEMRPFEYRVVHTAQPIMLDPEDDIPLGTLVLDDMGLVLHIYGIENGYHN